MKYRAVIWDWIVITFATLIIAVSVFFFMMPSHLSISSISGLAILLENFLPLSMSAITLIINAALLIVGFLFIGKGFGVKTVYSSLLMPVFLGVLEYFFPQGGALTNDGLLDMLCYCFLVSVGLAILFNRNASSGGLDIVANLMHRFLHMELGRAMSLAGMCIAISSVFVYDIKTALLSILGTYLNGIILDHFIFGSTIKKRVCIVSREMETIKAFILHELHSGATLYQAQGAYSDQFHTEIITIVDKNEYQKLMTFLREHAPDAFVTVYTVHSIIYRPKDPTPRHNPNND